MHAKAMLIDDDKLCIGTVNLNVRNLGVMMKSLSTSNPRKRARYSRIFETDLEQSIELDYARFKKETLLSRALESVVSLFSPLS